MIYKSNKEITGIHALGRVIVTLRVGTMLLWESVRSCFGKGFWINDKPWRDDNGWKN